MSNGEDNTFTLMNNSSDTTLVLHWSQSNWDKLILSNFVFLSPAKFSIHYADKVKSISQVYNKETNTIDFVVEWQDDNKP